MPGRGKKHRLIVSKAQRGLMGAELARRRAGKKGRMEGMLPMVAHRGLEGRMEGRMTGGLGSFRGIPPMKTNGNIKKRTRRSRIIL